MSRLRFWSIVVMILFVAAPIVEPRAQSWSEAVYTKPWSEPEGSDQTEEMETQLSTLPEIDPFLLDFESLYGTWYIWTPGTVIDLHDPEDGHYVTHDYVAGADQGVVAISDDGTYSMRHAAWDEGEIVEGVWRLSYPREINGEVLQAIVLIDGVTDTNWAVAPSPNGKIRLLWAMGWADGSATWVFDSELYRK